MGSLREVLGIELLLETSKFCPDTLTVTERRRKTVHPESVG
jgi:hypothetical protein